MPYYELAKPWFLVVSEPEPAINHGLFQTNRSEFRPTDPWFYQFAKVTKQLAQGTP